MVNLHYPHFAKRLSATLRCPQGPGAPWQKGAEDRRAREGWDDQAQPQRPQPRRVLRTENLPADPWSRALGAAGSIPVLDVPEVASVGPPARPPWPMQAPL